MANLIDKLFRRVPSIIPESAKKSDEDTGLTIKTSPTLWSYEIFILEWERRTLLRDLELMVIRDTRLDRANSVFANAATRGGITVTVTSGINARVQKAAQAVIDKLMKECKINAHLPGWARILLRGGDVFLNVIPALNPDGSVRISRIKSLPAITMERNDDMTDNFVDIKRAFVQIDPISRIELQSFPLWSINHVRWKYEEGERYGRSQYYSGREQWKKLQMMEEDLVVRRRTRAVQRRVHIIGNKDNPGSSTEVAKYKSENRLDDPKNAKVTTDYYINGLGEVKNLEGDANLHEIKDVEYKLENAMIGTGVPLHILGFGRNVNRDIVDDQKRIYKEDVQGLQDLLENGDPGPFSGLRAIFNMALALAGINPEDISINVRWTQVQELTFGQMVDIVAKLRATQPKPTITQKLGLTMLAKHLDLDDDKAVEEELKALNEEIAADRDAEAVEAANVNPVKPTTSNIDRSTVSSAGKAVQMDSRKKSNPLRSGAMDEIEKDIASDFRGSFGAAWAAVLKEKSFRKTIAHLLKNEVASDAQGDGEIPETELIKTFVLHKFDHVWKAEEEALTNRLLSRYLSTADVAQETLDHDFQTSVEFDHVSKDVKETLREQAGYRIRGVIETTRKNIVQAIDAAYTAGDTIDGYLDRIAEAIQAPDWRIEMIARTEMAFAFNMANLKYQVMAGYTRFRWVAVMDNRTCPKCAERHNKIFDVGVDPPPIHPRCRCILIPVD